LTISIIFPSKQAPPICRLCSTSLQALPNVNLVIHNENLQNFLVLISSSSSSSSSTWRQAHAKVQPAARARIDQSVSLKAMVAGRSDSLLYNFQTQRLCANY
jgi:hypothetical protein